jgi:hypothetical protein
VIPASFRDQLAAQRLAMCNDIGEAAYLCSAIGAALVARVKQLSAVEVMGTTETALASVRGDSQVAAEPGGTGSARIGPMSAVLEAMRARYTIDPMVRKGIYELTCARSALLQVGGC